MKKENLFEKAINLIIDTIKNNPKVEKVILFGSRAKGCGRNTSDIDLAVISPKMSFREFIKLYSQIEELNIPYKVDMLKFEKIGKEIKEEILRYGKVVYQRGVENDENIFNSD